MKKYYLAYEERYKKVHEEGLLWFSQNPTPELLEWVKHNNIPESEEICEIGCGEGRDSIYLASMGYAITAIDASPSTIEKCKQLSNAKGIEVNWIVGDATELKVELNQRFKWAYSIGTLHMLVEAEDRQQLIKQMLNLLLPGGKALILTMGDGKNERQTDTSTAFDLQERNHMETGRTLLVAGTSYRGVSWEFHTKELIDAGFSILMQLDTENDEYGKCMTVYLERGE